MWIYFLLPILGSKSGCNPLSRDLILQLVERLDTFENENNIYLLSDTYFPFWIETISTFLIMELHLLLTFFFSPLETRILSSPKARTILLNGAVRKGERVVPPLSLELLMRFTFPASSARLKVGIFKRDLLHISLWYVIFLMYL